MECHLVSSFVGILREIPKIFNKNGKLMISLTLLFLSIISISYLFVISSTKSLLSDLIIKARLIAVTNPKSPEFDSLIIEVSNYIRDFVGVQWIYIIIVISFSLYFVTATIIASALTHGGKNLSLKELLFSAAKSVKRPFFTWFYITLFGLGYVFFFLANLVPMALIIQQPAAVKALAIVLGIFATILYNYLAVIWFLALVISALEEKSGIEALGKAAQIVKGVQIMGFLLNLPFTVSTLVIFLAMRLMTIKQSLMFQIIIGLFVITFSFWVKLFWWMAYTLLYYQCKKIHGEEVELQGSKIYSIIPTSPRLDESIP